MTYQFLTKESTLMLIISEKFVMGFVMFPVLKQNLVTTNIKMFVNWEPL
jgi:hypothetical protein